MIEILNDYSPFSVFLPILAGLLIFPKTSELCKLFMLFLALLLVRDFGQFYIIKYTSLRNTMWISTIHVIIEVLVMFYIFKNMKFNSPNLELIQIMILVFGGLYFTLSSLYKDNFIGQNFLGYSVYYLSIIISSLLYLFDIAFYSRMDTQNFPTAFYIVNSFILLYSITLGNYILSQSGINDPYRYIWIQRNLVYVLFMMLATYTIYREKRIYARQ